MYLESINSLECLRSQTKIHNLMKLNKMRRQTHNNQDQPEILMLITISLSDSREERASFDGNKEQNLQEFIDSCISTAWDYQLSHSQRMQFLHNLFHGEALLF